MSDLLHLGFGRRGTIMLVEDSLVLMAVLVDTLGESYDLSPFGNAESAWQRLQTTVPDLILLDIMLPGMSGLDLLALLRAKPDLAEVPVIMTSSLEDMDKKRLAFELAASDYLTKPYEPEELRIRVNANMQTVAARRFLADQNRELERLVQLKTVELIRTRDATISAMAALAETRDNETGMHIQRTMNYMALMLTHLPGIALFRDQLEGKDTELIHKSAPLHDIGKVGVPDAILLKPGKLNAEERLIMETHTTLGRDAIIKAERYAGQSSFLQYARVITYTHHEKWDGTGYPEGLSGRAIPLEGRLMAICDVYDALVSKRVYKDAMSHAEALAIMADGRGQHFDPDLLDLFIELEQSMYGIALDLADTPEERKLLG